MARKLQPETTLERSVARTLRANGDGDTAGYIRDVLYGGCQSGVVGSLIYYGDTVRFYKRHHREIDAMLQELCSDCGCSPTELFGDKWDRDDPLARDQYNQNLLAWFGFEETTRRLAERAGIES